MMKNRMAVGMLGLALLGMMMISSATLAQKGTSEGKGKRGGMMGMMGKAIERLNLSADQKTKIKALRDQFKNDNQAALAEMKTLRGKMKESAKAQDKANAQATREQMKSRMETLRPAQQKLHQQILAVLTAEQRAELEKMKAERKERAPGERKGKKGKSQGGKTDLD